MNYIQFILFFAFVISLLIMGAVFLNVLKIKDRLSENKWIFVAEACLLGAILFVGAGVFLSIVKLYHLPFLWALVAAGYLGLLRKDVRERLGQLDFRRLVLDVPNLIMFILLIVFFVRSCYFVVDVDSHAVYLYTQKLWLAHGTSIFASKAIDHQTYIPQFDFIPCGLGIAAWGRDGLLFCELINFFWRFLAVVLVYGYTRYRFNGYYGLAAAMMVLFNDHFFMSGANRFVLLNGAVIAFLFAFAYNFWEGRETGRSGRLVLALICMINVVINKIVLVFAIFLLMGLCLGVLPNPILRLKEIFRNKTWLLSLAFVLFLTSLWFIKNQLATGLATFPLFAGKFQTLGWTKEMAETSREVFRGTSVSEFLKFSNYLMIWPGIHPLKLVSIAISLFPIILVFSLFKDNYKKEKLFELSFWLAFCFLAILGTCLASHQDPRYFRYPIAACAFAAILTLEYILNSCLRINNKTMIGVILIICALPGYQVMLHSGGGVFNRPSLSDNFNVILNKMHFDDVIERHFPQNVIAERDFNKNPEKAQKAAWFLPNQPGTPSAFLAPIRPQVGLWVTTVINWKSYDDPGKIKQNLKDYGIEYVMVNKTDHFEFLDLDQFAAEAMKFERYPETIYYSYDRIPELTKTKFKKK